jgi:hypothetical protein
MSMERLALSSRGDCPVCAALISPVGGLEESEILACPECQSMLVVEGCEGGRLVFGEAPRIEEDWGE